MPIKSQLLSETTGRRHPVCYNNSSATPLVAHFLAQCNSLEMTLSTDLLISITVTGRQLEHECCGEM